MTFDFPDTLSNGTKLLLPPGKFVCTHPITLDSFSCIEGSGIEITTIKFQGNFVISPIRSINFDNLIHTNKWFFEDGVPSGIIIKNISLDFSEWVPTSHEEENSFYNTKISAISFYCKKYFLDSVRIQNSPCNGFFSACSKQGGKKDFLSDSPEAIIRNLEIINCGGNGFNFCGPHDSLIESLITCHTKGMGVHIYDSDKHSGACDIGFIHAYASDDIAINIETKIKAKSLQADTGRKCGFKISNNAMSTIGSLECFKSRPPLPRDMIDNELEPYSVIIEACETQIGILRIRCDSGLHGLLLKGTGNMINNYHCDCTLRNFFKEYDENFIPIPLFIAAGQNFIGLYRVVNHKCAPIYSSHHKVIKKTYIRGIAYSEKYKDQKICSGLGFCENSRIDIM